MRSQCRTYDHLSAKSFSTLNKILYIGMVYVALVRRVKFVYKNGPPFHYGVDIPPHTSFLMSFICTPLAQFWLRRCPHLFVNTNADEWYMVIPCHMTLSKIKVMEAWNMWKWPISVYLLLRYACNHDELWYYIQILTRHILWYSISVLVQHHLTFRIRLFRLWMSFASYKELTSSFVQGLLIQ